MEGCISALMAPAKSQWSSYRYTGYNGSQIDKAMQSASCTVHPHSRTETVLTDKIRKLNLFQKCLGGSEAATVLVGMSEMKAHVPRSSVLEHSLRRKCEEASSPVPSPKAAAATLSHHVRTTQCLEKAGNFISHLRVSQRSQVSFSLTYEGEGCTRVHCSFLNLWADITANWASLVSLSRHCYYNSSASHVILYYYSLLLHTWGYFSRVCCHLVETQHRKLGNSWIRHSRATGKSKPKNIK